MGAPYSADAIANEFLKDHLGEISPMKLQKLVYYAHAWSLALFDQPLIVDRIEAWEFGPVIPALYHEFKEFGNRPIKRLAFEYDSFLSENAEQIPNDDHLAKAIVHRIWEMLGNKTAIQLSNMTHSENEPWHQTPKRRPGLAIPNEAIKRCFKNILDKSKS